MRGPAALVMMLVLSAGCATSGGECTFHSECGAKRYCLDTRCHQDCVKDIDCGGGRVCNEIGQCVASDGGVGLDGSVTVDGAMTIDAATGADAAMSVDARQPGSALYLDRCGVAGDCASGLCVADVGGSKFCSHSCNGSGECAHRQVCAGNVCRPDDTGRPCVLATPATCALGLCIGSVSVAATCTRPCDAAADCPAGFACTAIGGSRVCVDIERACGGGSDCNTGLCLTPDGCTATCRSAADCPARLAGLPPYTCAIAFGSASPICVPPADILGSDGAGATCRSGSVAGTTQCRSGACDDGAPLGPLCVQACTATGGCPPGLGCFPLADGASVTLVCERAGTGSLGATCNSGRDCDSGLCDASNRCTRLCNDGLCPSGWTCQPVPSTGIAICRP